MVLCDLREADLRYAGFEGANLFGSFLAGADLRGASLRGTYLNSTDMQGAKGFTNEEIEQVAAGLEDATMPNGQEYEDWLKSKDRGEDG